MPSYLFEGRRGGDIAARVEGDIMWRGEDVRFTVKVKTDGWMDGRVYP